MTESWQQVICLLLIGCFKTRREEALSDQDLFLSCQAVAPTRGRDIAMRPSTVILAVSSSAHGRKEFVEQIQTVSLNNIDSEILQQKL